MNPPLPNQYHPIYAGYVQLASNHNNVIELLNSLKNNTYHTFINLPAGKADYAYANGKWTVKQVLSHMIDTDRIFAYRSYCISRGDKTAFPGFDQDSYADNTDLANRTIQSLADEFKALREANLYFINALTDNQIDIVGTVSDHPVTVKALLYIMAGHELHHLNILKERYL